MKPAEKQIVALLLEVLKVARQLAKPARQALVTKAPALPKGIFPAQSKYNPYRAYWWNGQKSVYLGMFPSVAACKRAQREYRTGQQPTTGTRVANHRAPLAVVGKAA